MALPLKIGAAVAFIASAVKDLVTGSTKQMAIATGIWLAQKAFFVSIFFVALPILLYNIMVDLLFDFINYAIGYVSDANISPLAIEFTGLGGWIASTIMLPQAFSIYMSFVAIRFFMRFIPFMR